MFPYKLSRLPGRVECLQRESQRAWGQLSSCGTASSFRGFAWAHRELDASGDPAATLVPATPFYCPEATVAGAGRGRGAGTIFGVAEVAVATGFGRGLRGWIVEVTMPCGVSSP